MMLLIRAIHFFHADYHVDLLTICWAFTIGATSRRLGFAIDVT